MIKNLMTNLMNFLLPYKIKIHYYGGGACYKSSDGSWSVQEGKTDCWGEKRFCSKTNAERYIKKNSYDLHDYDDAIKTFIVSRDVDE